MRKRYKIELTAIVILILLAISLGVSKILLHKDKPKEQNVTNIISNINDYGYTLDDRDTDYMKEEFKKLEEILNHSEIDYKSYAESLSKLFVIDFYTLSNKINKYDVGSLEYILTDKVDNFKSKAMDTIYSDLIDNTYKDRIQTLPEITNVEVLSTDEEKIKIGEEELEGYKITLEYTYREDLGFDKEGTIYLAKTGNKLEVTTYNPKIKK